MAFYTGKRVAVLGGAGLIGSQLVELLIEEGAEVTVVDNFSRGRRQNIAGLMCQIENIDIADDYYGRLLRCFRWHSFHACFNLAAKVTGMHYNREHHAEMFHHNMLLQTRPLLIAVATRIPLFLQCSTVCVYPHDMSFPVSEEEGHMGEPEPTNAGYGWAKRMGERYAQWVAQEYDIKIGITRFSNCFGPRDYFDEETSHVIPAVIRRTIEDRVVTVYGTGNQRREFLYSRDAAIGAMKVLEHYPEADPVNIGNPDNRISIAGLAGLIQSVVGVNKPIVYDVTMPDGYPRRGSDINKLVDVTGWEPETSLREGLEATVEWYLENKGVA